MQKFDPSIYALIIFVNFATVNLWAQSLVMTGSVGLRTDCRSQSTGFTQTIGLRKSLSKKFEIGLTIGHAYTESRSEIFSENGLNAFIRHVDNPVPEGVINNLWSENSFPDLAMPQKGNRYDDLFLSLSTSYAIIQSKKNNINIGLGAGIHRKDHSEQIASIYPDEINWIFGGHVTTNTVIPIYAYNTFLDFSITPGIFYEYLLKRNLGLTFDSFAFIYPVSGSISLEVKYI